MRVFLGIFLVFRSATTFAGTFNTEIGIPLVECVMNGHSYNCQIDSGNPHTGLVDLDGWIADAAPTGKVRWSGLAGSSEEEDLIRAKSISVAGFSIGAREIVRLKIEDLPQTTTEAGVNGVVGNDILTSRSVEFNFSAHQIHFNQPIPSQLTRFALSCNNLGHSIVQGELNGDSVNAIWDTGSDQTAVDIGFIRAHAQNFTRIKSEELLDSAGEEFPTVLYRTKVLRIGSLEFRNVIVAATNFDISGIFPKFQVLLGHDLISRANWYLDSPHGHWAAVQTR